MTELQTGTILFFDGHRASPAPVRLILYDGCVHLHDPYDDRFIQSYPLEQAAYNRIGNRHFLYLDSAGLVYLQIDDAHPLVPVLQQQLKSAEKGWTARLMRQKTALLVPLVLALGAGLYLLLVSLVPLLGLQLMNRATERQLGDRLHEVMLSEMGLVGKTADTSGTRQLQAFADQLQLSKDYPIRLTLVHSDMVNAYALPGGNVVVYTGILKKIKTPEALAALLAHESTHVNQRHSLRSLLRSSANALVVSIIFGDVSGISGALAGNIENLSGLRYSRSLEQEADEIGMDLMVANGVSPQGMVQLMNTLDKEYSIPNELSFLSSHPLTKERIRMARNYSNKHPVNIKLTPSLQARFDALKNGLRNR